MEIGRVIALIDGEHHLPVIKAALKTLQEKKGHELLAAVFLGGEEKLRSARDYSSLEVPLILKDNPLAGLKEALERYHPDTVVDLSDEPVVGYRERFELANITLLAGASYVGADFRFDPPLFHDVATKPSLAITGLGKRVGKTALSAYMSRKLKEKGYSLAVVAMGRGGSSKPEVLYGQKEVFTPEFLLRVSQEGKHAASDYFEDALMAKVTTIGCRRCGGGMAGKPYISNVLEGARLANQLQVELLIFEGSGAALPPVKTDACLGVVSASQPLEYIRGYFGPYRLLRTDLVVLTMCEEPLASPEKIRQVNGAIKEINPAIKVIHTIFRPFPLGEITNKKVFLTTTANPHLEGTLRKYLEAEFDCEVVGVSFNLSRPERLKDEILAARGKFEVLLTELKAAGVEVATRLGKDFRVPVVYTDNVPIAVGGDGGLDEHLVALAQKAIRTFDSRAS